MSVPFVPATLGKALLDLVYIGLIVGAPIAIKRGRAWLVAHTTAQQRVVLGGLAHDAVLFVEHFVSGSGAERFAGAVKRVTDALAAAGIRITPAEIEQAVQAAYSAVKASGVLAASAPAPESSAKP